MSVVSLPISGTSSEDTLATHLASRYNLECGTISSKVACGYSITNQKIEAISLTNAVIPLYVWLGGTITNGKGNFAVLGADGVIEIVAGDAIAKGATVSINTTGQAITESSATGTHYIIGVALDAASASGDTIRIASCVARQIVPAE